MSRFAAILYAGLGTMAAHAQMAGMRPGIPGPPVHISMTRQFEIREAAGPTNRFVIPAGTPGFHYVRLDPSLLVISCERIKHALLRELDCQDNWRDRIHVELRRARSLDDLVYIDSRRYYSGWDYHVSVPEVLDSTRLVNSLVDTLVLEMANRKGDHPAEIPYWLGCGLTQDLLRSAHIELVIEPAKPITRGLAMSVYSVSSTNTNALAIANVDLHAATPLTLDQLSWPDQSQLLGPRGETYRSSAQLFVHDLLQLRDGPAAMRTFIGELPNHLNWQISFLHAFRADFASQLDLEKWWALRVVDFTGREVSQALSPEESWEKLESIIRPTVEVRTRAKELPLRTEVSLQTIIAKWEAAPQTELLTERSRMLYALRSRTSQEMAKIVDDYRKTIDLYLDRRQRDGYFRSPQMQAAPGLDHGAEQTIAELNILDSIREDLRPKSLTMQSADVGKVTSH